MTLDPKKRRMVMAGCLCLALAIAAYGLSLSTIQGPILQSLNGEEYFSLITVLSAIALCVLTPVGGSLYGMIGGRRLMLYAGLINIAAGLIMAFVPNLWVFLIFRVVLAASQGAYASLPFILVREIYPAKESPKGIGYITMMSSIGSVAGSYAAGWLAQHGLMKAAIAFPVIILAIGVFLIWTYLPASKEQSVKLDWTGIALLTVALGGLLLGLNNGPLQGWFSMGIILSFAIGFGGLLLFIYWEDKTQIPLIPLRMFRIKEYALLLVIGFGLMFFMNAMNVYIPQAVQTVLQAPTSVSGALQIPMTIVTMILPAIAGAWVVKQARNMWIALAIAAIALIIPFGLLVFIGPDMPVWFIMAMLAIVGVSNSFRSVGLLPSAQSVLQPKDLGIGTSLIGFISTLSGSIASALFGLAYTSLTARTPGMRGMIDGIDTICLIVCLAAAVSFLLIILFFRPMLEARVKAKETSAQ